MGRSGAIEPGCLEAPVRAGLASALVQLTVGFFCVQYVVAQLVSRGFLWSCCFGGAWLSAWISEPLWAAAPYTPGQPLPAALYHLICSFLERHFI